MKKKLLKKFLLVFFLITLIFLLSCKYSQVKINYKNTKFATISDLHIIDPSLITEGEEFTKYILNDRKMLIESKEILEETIKKILEEKVEFVLIAGDLTKDGEKESHLLVRNLLKNFTDNGIKVFVVPGNHDINNPHSYKFYEKSKERIETISKNQFAKIYEDFGYKNGLSYDDASLSYIYELNESLWLLAIDACQYEKNDDKEPITNGKVKKETIKWIEENLKLAKEKNKNVIAMVHHGITPHYFSNMKYYPEYVLDNYKEIRKLFAKYNVKLTFTGHYHAQDITKYSEGGNTIYDIETGSPVTYPSPYRICEISDNKIIITSKFIESIPSKPNFKEYSYKYLIDGTMHMAEVKLKKYKVDQNSIDQITHNVATAYAIHLKGDEKYDENLLKFKNVSFIGSIVIMMYKNLLKGWMTDIEPEDNFITIDLHN